MPSCYLPGLAARPTYFQIGGDALVVLAIVAIWWRLIWPPHLARYPELPARGLLVDAVLLFAVMNAFRSITSSGGSKRNKLPAASAAAT
jgi:hypothetical protein